MKKWMAFVNFEGFFAIITTISNNTRLTYTRRMCPNAMKELFSNRKREEAVVDEAHFP